MYNVTFMMFVNDKIFKRLGMDFFKNNSFNCAVNKKRLLNLAIILITLCALTILNVTVFFKWT